MGALPRNHGGAEIRRRQRGFKRTSKGNQNGKFPLLFSCYSSLASISSLPFSHKLRWCAYSFAILIRAVLILLSGWFDKNSRVKFTDIDYAVYSEGGSLVLKGLSPYEFNGYRYTPLIAYLAATNFLFFPACLKCIFAAVDILTSLSIEKIILLSGQGKMTAVLLCSFWMLNPIVMGVSTRGSCESLPCAAVIFFILFLMQRKIGYAAICLAFAVHLKLYPIIYLPTAIFTLNSGCLEEFSQEIRNFIQVIFLNKGEKKAANSGFFAFLKRLFGCLNYPQIRFFSIFFAVSAALIGIFYYQYGYSFIYESFIYHTTRKDTQHNFSFMFYPFFLSSGSPVLTEIFALMSLLPQAAATIGLGLKYYRENLIFSMFLQTLAFVALNKVCTAQYFLWWLCLAPVALGAMQAAKKGIRVYIFWLMTFFFCLANWLLWAYRLEFLQHEVMPQVFISSCLISCAMLTLVVQMVLIEFTLPSKQKVN